MHFHPAIWLLLFFCNTLFPVVKNEYSDSDDEKYIKFKPRYIPEIQDYNFPDAYSGQDEDDLSKEDIAELELVFELAPKRAQAIINHLQDPNYFPHNRDYRSAYFVGEPGSGKTATARYIAHKMSKEGWDYKFIASTELLGKYRNQTAIRLRKELEEVVRSQIPTIVIIDELHRLLENTESKHHDTDTAATALWLFLDKQRNNEKFFFIGTLNRITKLPKPFKDRIIIDVIKFPLIDDPKIKNSIFRKFVTLHKMSFDKDVTDEFLDAELAKLGPCVGRNIHKISKLMFRIQKMDSKERVVPGVVKREVIAKAIADYLELQSDMHYDFVEETDDERQNRHHIENIRLQKQHHRESQRLQEQHFVQQQLIQLISSQYRLDPVAILGGGLHGEQIEGCLSDKQIQIFYNTAQEAKARKQKMKESSAKKR